ncbi:MAG TPA: hypothetical protein VFE51_17160 [Verrucomicrobiae bacterium]|nr:hypothetical protein [Verrucomicrobiae bacterium]
MDTIIPPLGGNQYTTGPLAAPAGPRFDPEFLRLPKPRERDPLFGLSRSYLNLLILPSSENNFRPPVRSVVLRRKGAKTGVRLIDVQSLRGFILSHAPSEAVMSATIDSNI